MRRITKSAVTALTIILLTYSPVLAVPADAGFVLNDESDSVFGEVTIIRQNQGTDADPRVLYEGDRILGSNLDRLKIQLNPGFRVEYNSAERTVVLDRSQANKGILERITDFFGLSKAQTPLVLNSPRGETVSEQYPIPGFFATLLKGQPATFGWLKPARTIVFLDDSRKEIYRQDLSGKTSIDLTPEEIGLKPGVVYTWKVDNSNWEYRIAVLDEVATKQILDDLHRIDDESNRPYERQLKKIAYLQLASDVYQNKLDLYWLSYQIAKKAEPPDAAATAMIERFKERMIWHLNLQMYEVK